MNEFRLLPEQASDIAPHIDSIYFGLLIMTGAVLLLVFTLIVTFSVRYRRGTTLSRSPLATVVGREFEIGWTLATLLAFVLIFGWAAAQDFRQLRPSPPGALEVHVVAKQWMWKTQQPGGQREIDALHLPRGTPVHLVMNSEDVIHSFYVPAFRLKQDVVPGHTEYLDFTATKTGTYHLLCAEFCGADHSAMGGTVVVMEPEDFARWLQTQPQGDDLAAAGAALFISLGCSGCHNGGGTIRAPSLVGLYGMPVPLSDGRVVTADDAYLRDSILQPRKDIVASYDPVMPSFGGRISESDLIKLIAYIRSLNNKASP